ncbi:MAG: hypothetical protein U1F98_10860 [Verrucomicrobiota bacterium]
MKFMPQFIKKEPEKEAPDSAGESVVGMAALGCLTAGVVGIMKALNMQTGADVMFCLVGASAAFGVLFYICFRRF